MREALYPKHDVAFLALAVLLLSLWARVDAQVQFSSEAGTSVYNSAVPASIVVMQYKTAFQLTVSTSFVDITIEPQVQQRGNLTIVLNSCDATGSAPAIRFNSTVQLYSITVALNCTWPGARGIDALLVIKESTPLVVTIQVLSSGKVTLGTTSNSSLVTILDNNTSWNATLSGLRPLLYHVDVIGGVVTVNNGGGWGPFVLSDAPTATRVSSGEMRLSLSSLAKITLSSSSSYAAGIFGLSQSITVTPSINISVSGSTVTLDRCAFVVFGATVAIPSFAMNVTSSTVSFSSASSVLTADLQHASGGSAPYSFTGAVTVSAALSFLKFSNAYIFDIVSSFSSVASFQFALCTVTMISSSSLVSRSTFSAPTYEGLSFVFDNTTLSMNARSNLLLASTTTVTTLSLEVRNGGTITASGADMFSVGKIASNASISISTKGRVELLTSAAMFKVSGVASAVLLSMTSGGSMTVSSSSNFLIGDMTTWNGTLDGTANIVVKNFSTFLSISTAGNVSDTLTNSKVTLDTSSAWVAASTSISFVSTTIARSSHVELLSQSQWVKSSLIGSNAPRLEVSGSGSLLVSDSMWWSGTTVNMWSVSVLSASQVTLQKGSQLLEFIGGTTTSGGGCAVTVEGVSTSVSVVDQSSLWSTTATALNFSIESLDGIGRVAVLHSSTLLNITSAPLSNVRVSIVNTAVEFTPSSSVGWLLQGPSQLTTSVVVSLIGTSFVCRESHWDACRHRWMSGVSTLPTAVNVTSSTLRWGTRQRAIPTQMPFAIAGTTNNRVDLNDGKLGGSESKSQTQTSSATSVTSFSESWTLSQQVSRTLSLSVMSKSGCKDFSESSSFSLKLTGVSRLQTQTSSFSESADFTSSPSTLQSSSGILSTVSAHLVMSTRSEQMTAILMSRHLALSAGLTASSLSKSASAYSHSQQLSLSVHSRAISSATLTARILSDESSATADTPTLLPLPVVISRRVWSPTTVSASQLLPSSNLSLRITKSPLLFTTSAFGTSSVAEPEDRSPFTHSLVVQCLLPHIPLLHAVDKQASNLLCQTHLCPVVASSEGATLHVGYDELNAAPSLLLLLNSSTGSNLSAWVRMPSLVTLEGTTVAFIAVNDSFIDASMTVAVLLQRSLSGWPGVADRPYATQRLSLIVSMSCVYNETFVYRNEVLLAVEPRSSPIAAAVEVAMQSSQLVAGVGGAGAVALTVGRLMVSQAVLSCENVLKGRGPGVGVLSVSGGLLAVVDTIMGNALFLVLVGAATVGSGLAVYRWHCAALPGCSFAAFMRIVLRLPHSLFPACAATLPSTVTAIVALLRDSPVEGGVAAGAYLSTAAAVIGLSGFIWLVAVATRQMVSRATLHRRAPSGGLLSIVWSAFVSQTEWLPSSSDASLFEGTTRLWFVPLDLCAAIAMAVASSLPIAHSASVCLGANIVNATGCLVMLVAVAVWRPFSTTFGKVHAIVTSFLLLSSVVCGLAFVAVTQSVSKSTQQPASTSRLLAAIGYLSGGVVAMSLLKALVDTVSIVTAARERMAVFRSSFVSTGLGLGELPSLPSADVNVSGGQFPQLTLLCQSDDIFMPEEPTTDIDNSMTERLTADGLVNLQLGVEDFPLVPLDRTEAATLALHDLVNAYINAEGDFPPSDGLYHASY